MMRHGKKRGKKHPQLNTTPCPLVAHFCQPPETRTRRGQPSTVGALGRVCECLGVQPPNRRRALARVPGVHLRGRIARASAMLHGQQMRHARQQGVAGPPGDVRRAIVAVLKRVATPRRDLRESACAPRPLRRRIWRGLHRSCRSECFGTDFCRTHPLGPAASAEPTGPCRVIYGGAPRTSQSRERLHVGRSLGAARLQR